MDNVESSNMLMDWIISENSNNEPTHRTCQICGDCQPVEELIGYDDKIFCVECFDNHDI